jgi:hypothetical protein
VRKYFIGFAEEEDTYMTQGSLTFPEFLILLPVWFLKVMYLSRYVLTSTKPEVRPVTPKSSWFNVRKIAKIFTTKKLPGQQ